MPEPICFKLHKWSLKNFRQRRACRVTGTYMPTLLTNTFYLLCEYNGKVCMLNVLGENSLKRMTAFPILVFNDFISWLLFMVWKYEHFTKHYWAALLTVNYNSLTLCTHYAGTYTEKSINNVQCSNSDKENLVNRCFLEFLSLNKIFV